MADRFDIHIEQGATFELEAQFFDSNKVPRDLTGFVVRMQVRPLADSPYVIDELTTENGRIALDNLNAIKLQWTAEQTSRLPSGSHAYDIELATVGERPERVERLFEGALFVDREVTR